MPAPFNLESLEGRVFLSAAAAENYGPSLFAATLRQGQQSQRVALLRNDGTKTPLANRPTWIVVHGWQGEPDGSTKRLADAVDGNSPKDQVLILDWSGPAASFNPLQVVAWVPPVAKWVANTLTKAGLSHRNLNLVGFSLGGYMIGAIAGQVAGGVNRIVGLDPATDLFNLNLFGVNYARHSRYAQTFVGSFLSTPRAAFTADETIALNVGPYGDSHSHINVLDLYITMLNRTNAGNPDPISRLFDLDRLSPAAKRPWRTNAFSGGYEARLIGRPSGDDWLPDRLVYRSVETGGRVLLRA